MEWHYTMKSSLHLFNDSKGIDSIHKTATGVPGTRLRLCTFIFMETKFKPMLVSRYQQTSKMIRMSQKTMRKTVYDNMSCVKNESLSSATLGVVEAVV